VLAPSDGAGLIFDKDIGTGDTRALWR